MNPTIDASLTIAAALIQVRALGLTASYSSIYREYRVNYRRHDPRWTAESCYFTNDATDAVGTARIMAGLTAGSGTR